MCVRPRRRDAGRCPGRLQILDVDLGFPTVIRTRGGFDLLIFFLAFVVVGVAVAVVGGGGGAVGFSVGAVVVGGLAVVVIVVGGVVGDGFVADERTTNCSPVRFSSFDKFSVRNSCADPLARRRCVRQRARSWRGAMGASGQRVLRRTLAEAARPRASCRQPPPPPPPQGLHAIHCAGKARAAHIEPERRACSCWS